MRDGRSEFLPLVSCVIVGMQQHARRGACARGRLLHLSGLCIWLAASQYHTQAGAAELQAELRRLVMRYASWPTHRSGSTDGAATTAWIAEELGSAGVRAVVTPVPLGRVWLSDGDADACVLIVDKTRVPCYPVFDVPLNRAPLQNVSMADVALVDLVDHSAYERCAATVAYAAPAARAVVLVHHWYKGLDGHWNLTLPRALNRARACEGMPSRVPVVVVGFGWSSLLRGAARLDTVQIGGTVVANASADNVFAHLMLPQDCDAARAPSPLYIGTPWASHFRVRCSSPVDPSTSGQRPLVLAVCRLGLLAALCSLLSALCSLLSALCSLLSALCSLLSALCSLRGLLSETRCSRLASCSSL
jgi:hypothetical protein